MSTTFEKSIVFFTRAARYPPVEHKRQRLVGGDPLPIIPSGEVNVRAGGDAPLAGGMTDTLARPQVGARADAVAAFYVHIEQDPAGLFVAIAVHVLDHRAIAGAQDQPVGDRHHPGFARDAPQRFSRRGEIHGCPPGAITPAAAGTAGASPFYF